MFLVGNFPNSISVSYSFFIPSTSPAASHFSQMNFFFQREAKGQICDKMKLKFIHVVRNEG